MSAHPTQSPRSRGEVWNADHAVEYVLKQSHAAKPALLVEEVSDHCCFIIDYPLIARRIVCSRAQPGLPSTLPLEAAISSRIRSPVNSCSKCANDSNTFGGRCSVKMAVFRLMRKL